jgi:hypothetical protein
VSTEVAVARVWALLSRWRYVPALITAREALRLTRVETDAAAFRIAWDTRSSEELRRDKGH